MTLDKLDNLARVKQLKIEPPDQTEFIGLVESAKTRLHDAQIEGLSDNGRFSLAYGATHGFALAALRWHGYRSTNRYLVFQCLEQTLGLETAKWRILDKCHKLRNIAEHEGLLEITPQLLDELINVSVELCSLVEKLGPVK